MSPVSVGIVLVSHSRALAEAALDLARRLIVAVDVPVELAAGLADGELGTDAGLIVSVVEPPADRCDGVPMLADLGSGLLSGAMAVAMLGPAAAERVRVAAAALPRPDRLTGAPEPGPRARGAGLGPAPRARRARPGPAGRRPPAAAARPWPCQRGARPPPRRRG